MMQKQKAVIIVLAIAGVFALGLGVWRTGYNIKSPFFLKSLDSISLAQDNVFDPYKDTDGDGLTDIDEIGFYNTSPYLEDTDSDAISDGEEVDSGTDPNCPQNRDCATSEPVNVADTNIFDISNAIDPSVSQTESKLDGSGLINETGNIRSDLTAQEIRDLLRSAGIDEATLSQLDDKTLKQIYQETLNSGQ